MVFGEARLPKGPVRSKKPACLELQDKFDDPSEITPDVSLSEFLKQTN